MRGMVMDYVPVLADFAGTWQVQRQITPHVGTPAQFAGQAVWSRADGGMRYVETGLMTLASHPPMQAEQRYFWADDLAVFFDDGRFFHQIPAAGGQVAHWCAPDRYTGTYDFAGWPRFQITWDVTGPRKNYRSVTEYARC